MEEVYPEETVDMFLTSYCILAQNKGSGGYVILSDEMEYISSWLTGGSSKDFFKSLPPSTLTTPLVLPIGMALLITSSLDDRTSVARLEEYGRDHQAVTLNLISREWSFDIVPCFHTVPELDGRSYYLIPNGEGRWMKTDPKFDRSCVTDANKYNDGNLLEVIRLIKKWNKVKNATTIKSYLLETMLVTYGKTNNFCSYGIKRSFISALERIERNIYWPVYDLKGIQGDINTLEFDDKDILFAKAGADVQKARTALQLEADGEHKQAIQKWGEIFGSTFPKYED